ncbi:LysR family transcriptional regulator, partial [Actinoalloteichus caeruleus]
MTRLPDPDSLRLLVLIAELGSLGRAATELGVAQPSASKRLSALERLLGLVLVDRTRRGSTLTPDGVLVAGWSRRVLDEMAALATGADALRAKRDAELRVAASMTLAEHLVPAWIGELRRHRPQLYVGLQVINSEQVIETVHAGEVDLGFVETPRTPPGLATRVVAQDRLVVVVTPGHDWADRPEPLAVAELSATPLVLREHGSGTRETLDHELRRAGVPAATALVELGSATAVRGAVVA